MLDWILEALALGAIAFVLFTLMWAGAFWACAC